MPEIQAELKHYKDKFAGKTVFCNCDDPFESNFVKYFLMNFNGLGLKELIATGYKTSPVQGTELGEKGKPYVLRVTETKPYLRGTQTDLDITGAKQFLEKEQVRVMIPLEGNWAKDKSGNILQIAVKEEYVDEKTGKTKKRTVKQDLYYEAGDFRSDMSVELLQQADIVVTNPPFSLFREYVAQLMQYGKQFLILGNVNAITYKEIFPLLKDNLVWIGCQAFTGSRWYRVLNQNDAYVMATYKYAKKSDDGVWLVPQKTTWFTNLDHAKRHQMLPLDIGFTYVGHEDDYPMYDNYEAIEVSKVSQIPCDYMGVMGVPITFLDKYCPEQFEILNCNDFRRCDSVPVKPHGLIKDKEGSISIQSRAEQSRAEQSRAEQSRAEQSRAEQNGVCSNTHQAAIWLPVQYLMGEKSIGGFSSVEEIRNAVAEWCECKHCEVPFTDIMGVPITFLDKYCPEQFEIVGNEYSLGLDKGRGYVHGCRMYSRIFVRRK